MKSLGILPATVQKENLGILDISVDFQGSWRRSRVHNKKKKKGSSACSKKHSLFASICTIGKESVVIDFVQIKNTMNSKGSEVREGVVLTLRYIFSMSFHFLFVS